MTLIRVMDKSGQPVFFNPEFIAMTEFDGVDEFADLVVTLSNGRVKRLDGEVGEELLEKVIDFDNKKPIRKVSNAKP